MKYLQLMLDAIPDWAKVVIIIILISAVFGFEGKIELKFQGADPSIIVPDDLKDINNMH